MAFNRTIVFSSLLSCDYPMLRQDSDQTDFMIELAHGNYGIIEIALGHSEIFAASLICICGIMLLFGIGIYTLVNANALGIGKRGEKSSLTKI